MARQIVHVENGDERLRVYTIFVATVPPICFGQSSWTSQHERQNGFRDSKRTRTTRNRCARIACPGSKRASRAVSKRKSASRDFRNQTRFADRPAENDLSCNLSIHPSAAFSTVWKSSFPCSWTPGRWPRLKGIDVNFSFPSIRFILSYTSDINIWIYPSMEEFLTSI